jgi:hypothetical protein
VQERGGEEGREENAGYQKSDARVPMRQKAHRARAYPARESPSRIIHECAGGPPSRLGALRSGRRLKASDGS